MSWKLLTALPVDVIVENVLSQLVPCDLVRLDEAFPPQYRRDLRRTLYHRIPAIELSHLELSSFMFIERLLRCGLNIKVLSLHKDRKVDLDMLRRHSHQIHGLAVQCSDSEPLQLLDELALDPILCAKVKEAFCQSKSGKNAEQLRKFPNLTTLAQFIQEEEDIRAISQFLSWCNNIHTLKIWSNGKPTRSVLSSILSSSSSKQLKRLNVRVSLITDEDISSIAERCPELVEITLWNFHTSEALGRSMLTEGALQQFARCCQRLQTVQIKVPTPPSSRVLCTLMENCPSLNHANIKDAIIDDSVLRAAAANCPRLTDLNGHWAVTSTEVVTQATSLLGRLQGLHVTLRDSATVGTLSLAIVYCKALQQLSLHLNAIKFDRVLSAIAAHCRRLQILTISETGLSSKELAGYVDRLVSVARASAQTLTEIDVDWSIMSEDQILEFIAASKSVQSLIGYCQYFYFAEEHVCAAAVNCPKLTCIDPISPWITDRAVLALAQNCPKLGWLRLKECSLVSESALLQLVDGNKVGIEIFPPEALSQEAHDRIAAACAKRKEDYERSLGLRE